MKKTGGSTRGIGSGNPDETEDGTDSFQFISDVLENLENQSIDPEYRYQSVNPDVRDYQDNGEMY